MAYLLPKSAIEALFASWAEQAEVYVPQKQENFSHFAPYTEKSQLAFSIPHNTRIPPKALFLPQSEVMLKYSKLGQTEMAEQAQTKRVIFGIHACDSKGVHLLDTVFATEKNTDPYWTTRRENTVVIGIGCNEPCPTCFCTSVQSGPFGSQAMDAICTDLGDAYHVRTIGKKALPYFSHLEHTTPEQDRQAKGLQEKAIFGIEHAFPVKGLKQKLDANFDSPYWQSISESCLGCGICTFLCPTCFCFDIVDEAQRSERVRNWDTCMFRTYSLETSGHNPRPTKRERTRQRVMHKFSYWLDHINKIGCTGCGRCVRYCPVGLDIRAMLRTASELESEVSHAG